MVLRVSLSCMIELMIVLPVLGSFGHRSLVFPQWSRLSSHGKADLIHPVGGCPSCREIGILLRGLLKGKQVASTKPRRPERAARRRLTRLGSSRVPGAPAGRCRYRRGDPQHLCEGQRRVDHECGQRSVESISVTHGVDHFAILDIEATSPVVVEVPDGMRALSAGHPGNTEQPQRREGNVFIWQHEISRDDRGRDIREQLLGRDLPATAIQQLVG